MNNEIINPIQRIHDFISLRQNNHTIGYLMYYYSILPLRIKEQQPPYV